MQYKDFLENLAENLREELLSDELPERDFPL